VAGERWIRMLGSIHYLFSPTSGSPLGVALHACTACKPYPGADKGTPRISQRWTQKWRYGSIETEHPAHLIGAEPR
jgi:hypothetical protein